MYMSWGRQVPMSSVGIEENSMIMQIYLWMDKRFGDWNEQRVTPYNAINQVLFAF